MSHDAHNPIGDAQTPDPRELLDAYLDGALAGPELAAFERSLAANPELKAEVEAQRSINASLSRMFHRAEAIVLRDGFGAPAEITPPPPALRLTDDAREAERPAHGSSARRPWFSRSVSPWSAVAAVLVFAVLAGLYVAGVIDPTRWIHQGPSLIAAADVYNRKVATGYLPDWVCANDAQFIKNTTDMFNEPLLVRSTKSVQVVGWSYYEPVLSNGTAILLTKVDGKPVIVVMDKKEHDRTIHLPKSSGLHDFSQIIGNATLHEISPFDAPHVLPLVERK